MLALAEQLLADGVPLDGIGFQGHLIVGSTPGNLATQLTPFTDLGLDVAVSPSTQSPLFSSCSLHPQITELDIRMSLPVTDALLAQQKKDYQSIVSACQSVPRCVGVTIWDYTDKVSVA